MFLGLNSGRLTCGYDIWGGLHQGLTARGTQHAWKSAEHIMSCPTTWGGDTRD